MEIINPMWQRRLVSQAYERELLMQTFYQTVPITREVTSILLLGFFLMSELNYNVENLEEVERVVLSTGLKNVGKLEESGEARVSE